MTAHEEPAPPRRTGKERIMQSTERGSLLWTGMLLAVLTGTVAARGGETLEPPSATVTVNPWHAPCACTLEPLGDPEKSPTASVGWTAGWEPPAEGKPRKVKVGTVLEFRATGDFAHGVDAPSDWTFIANARDEETYTWEVGDGVVDVTADHVEDAPSNRRYFKFTQSGNFSVRVKYKREMARDYICPFRKRTTPLAICGETEGPCPLADAVKTTEETVTAEDESAFASFPVRAYGLELTVRRKGTGEFGESATVAAGGLSSDVHTAEIRAKLVPDADDGDTFDFNVKISSPHPDYLPSFLRPHEGSGMTWNAERQFLVGTLTATRDGWRCTHEEIDENGEPMDVPHYYALRSSRHVGNASLSGDEPYVSASASAVFRWDSGGPRWADLSGEYANVPFKLDTVYQLAEDVPIDGHAVRYRALTVEGYTWNAEKTVYEHFEKNVEVDGPLGAYVSFAALKDGAPHASLTVHGDADGRATAWMSTHSSRDVVVTSVEFEAADTSVFKTVQPDTSPVPPTTPPAE